MVQLVVTGPRWRPKRTPACRYCGFRCAIRAKHPARYCRRGDRVLFCCTAVDVGPWPFADNVLCAANVRSPYENEVVKAWTAEIARSDGFIFVTAEYNYGPPAVLKNALDWVYPEWNRKAAAFVSYGSVSGARSVQQLRETAIELQMAPVRSSVHIPVATLWAHFQGGDVETGLAELEASAKTMIDDLLWWTAALKTARASAA
jgi:NAD(P)H-dependent FMN reductase